jgi:hypothetical protein
MAICSKGSNALETVGMTTLTTTSSTRIAVKKISSCRTVLLGLFVAGRYYAMYHSLRRKVVRRFSVYFIRRSPFLRMFQFRKFLLDLVEICTWCYVPVIWRMSVFVLCRLFCYKNSVNFDLCHLFRQPTKLHFPHLYIICITKDQI